jgi:hypothetical protein
VPPKAGNTAQIFRRTTGPATASRPNQLIKARPDDDYVTIEKGMIDIEQAPIPEKPHLSFAGDGRRMNRRRQQVAHAALLNKGQ